MPEAVRIPPTLPDIIQENFGSKTVKKNFTKLISGNVSREKSAIFCSTNTTFKGILADFLFYRKKIQFNNN